MYIHPDAVLRLATELARERRDEAARHRLLTAARRARRAGRGKAARPRPAVTLAPCAPAAGPALR
jgi:hypothetical protein